MYREGQHLFTNFQKLCTSCAQIPICFTSPFCQKFLTWNPSSRQTNMPRISPLNFLGIHFYTCIASTEKNSCVLLHLIQVIVVSPLVLFIWEVQRSESTSSVSVFISSRAMLPHCTKIEMVCFCIKLGDWLWITLG